MADIVLVFPRMGYGDFFIKDPPLSLLYASSKAVRNGFSVEIIDQRNCYENWKEILQNKLKTKPLIVGVSVMTGRPIHYAIEISKFVKNVSPETTIVWGGHHPTVLPELTLNNSFIDFLIRGAGSIPLAALAKALRSDVRRFDTIPGLSYKRNGKLIHNNDIISHEEISFENIPYHLVDITSYNRLGNKNIFVIITSFGCSHNCSFCYAPVIYRNRRWVAHSPERVIAHMQMAIDRFGVNSFSIIDDDFFVDMDRAKMIFEMVREKRWVVTFQFRGARIDELDKMSNEMLSLMERIGVKHIMIGAESGSDFILNLMNKGITVEQIIRVNRKLARHSRITPMYNLLTGMPGETLGDMKRTVNLMRQLVRENQYCEISMLEHFMPLPGTKLFSVSKEKGFKEPKTLESWSRFESETRADYCPWIDWKQRRYIKIMQVASLFIDNKIAREVKSKRFTFKMIIVLAYFYKFIARFRVKFHISILPIEYHLLKWLNPLLEKAN